MSQKLRINHLEGAKDEVRQLTANCTGPDDKLAVLMAELNASQTETTPIGHLKRVVLIVSSLLTNAASKSLPRSKVAALIDLAEASLNALDIKPGKAKLSLIYGELHYAISLNYVEQDDQWGAVWQQELGFELSRTNVPGGERFQKYVSGFRFWRCGYVKDAIRLLLESIDSASDKARENQTNLLLARSYRLLGDFENAEKILAQMHQASDTATKLEAIWEFALIESVKSKSAYSLRNLIMKEKTHVSSHYRIEALLWAWAFGDDRSVSKLNKISYIRKKFKNEDLGPNYAIAKWMEEATESETQDFRRFVLMEKITKNLHKSKSLDIEVLCRAAIVRLLDKVGSSRLLHLANLDYSSMNLMISQGESSDTMDLLGAPAMKSEKKVS